MTTLIAENEHYLKNLCFSDESTFYLSGEVNKHNVRYWSDFNPYIYREGHTQRPQKLNVWTGILGNYIVGLFFINGNLTGELYLTSLRDIIDPLITQIVENAVDEDGQLEFDVDNIHFQQDGCLAHYYRDVRNYLEVNYPNRWIGRRGPIEWPPRSHDLALNDFFLGII